MVAVALAMGLVKLTLANTQTTENAMSQSIAMQETMQTVAQQQVEPVMELAQVMAVDGDFRVAGIAVRGQM